MSTFVLFLKVTHYKVKIKDENVKKVKVKVHGKNCNSLQVKVLTKVTKYCNEVIVLRYNPALVTDRIWLYKVSFESMMNPKLRI